MLRRPRGGRRRLPEFWGLLLKSFGGRPRRANSPLGSIPFSPVWGRRAGGSGWESPGRAYEPVLRKPEKNSEGVQGRLGCGGVAFAPLFAAQVTVICSFSAAVSTGGEMKW